MEGGVKLPYQRIYATLRNLTFGSLTELNTAIVEQLDIHHRTPMQKKGYTRFQRFMDLEKPTLQPLPPEPYVIKHRAEATVGGNYHITVRKIFTIIVYPTAISVKN